MEVELENTAGPWRAMGVTSESSWKQSQTRPAQPHRSILVLDFSGLEAVSEFESEPGSGSGSESESACRRPMSLGLMPQCTLQLEWPKADVLDRRRHKTLVALALSQERRVPIQPGLLLAAFPHRPQACRPILRASAAVEAPATHESELQRLHL
eukprot:994124-Rhodomonas_salina.1